MHFSKAIAQRLAQKHGIRGDAVLMPASGMVNEAWLIDDNYVIRITIDPEADDEVERESWVVPLIIGSGVKSPNLIAFDFSKEFFERPYTIYERAGGNLLGHLDEEPMQFEEAYYELGAQIAKLHIVEVDEGKRDGLRKSSIFDARVQLTKTMAETPSLTSEENRILDLISNLEQDQGTYERGVFLHQDIHPWNLFVDAKSGTLSAIIDWGDAAFGDPAGEFASMPMCAMPAMLEGYRDTGGVVDGRLKQRALSLGLALSLWEIRELDEARFARQWWRHPRGGFAETEKWIDQILAGA